ncbi:MAG: RNase adapter RapZ [Egibacteraceae bacterium]
MTPEIVIITGLSGAGLTTSAKVMEDMGYFAIDNIPLQLIERVVDLATAPGSTVARIALVLDVRGRQFFGDLRNTIKTLEERSLPVRVLFLEAADETLVKRFEAGRRTHPLAGADRVVDGISRERALVADLRGEADLVIDTTDINIHELRERLVDAFADPADHGMVTTVVSFGFKYGAPRDADVVLDCRFLPNPHWVDELRPLTGLDAPVREYVLGDPLACEYLQRITALLELVVPGSTKEGKRYLTIAIGCTGGKHRSVVLGEEVAARLRAQHVAVQVDHRDRLRE